MRTVSGGVIWGAVATVVGLSVASLVAPVRDSADFAAVPQELGAAPQDAPSPQAPDVAAPEALTAPQPPQEAPQAPQAATDPAPERAQAMAPKAPVIESQPPDAVPQPIEVPTEAPTEQPTEQPTDQPAEQPDMAQTPEAAPEMAPEPTEPQVEPSDQPAPVIALPQPGFDTPTPGVTVGRLPAIGQQPQEPEEPVEAAPTTALERNAEPFRRSGDKPLMAIIIVDDGAVGLDQATLSTFSFPVTFAIDAARPDAAQVMRAYRKAGFETVLMTGGLPAAATPQDLEVTLAQYLTQMDQTVAIMDAETGGLKGNRALLGQLVDIAAASGHGLISFDQGLNTADQMAKAANVPSALIYRTMDAEAERASVIRRVLNRAAFKAGQDGHVVMLGHNRAETVTALFEWALEGSSEVDLAPLSEVLRYRF